MTSQPENHDQDSPPMWTWLNLVGLDSPLVAVSWQWMFAHSFGSDIPTPIYLILALSTWCIYLADRIFDAVKIQNIALATHRHRFTKKHLERLIVILVLASITNLILIVEFIPKQLLITGIITLGLIGIYYLIRLTRLKKAIKLIPREVLCGMLFALGCAIGPHAYATNEINSFREILPVICFGLLCSASCIIISIWEQDADHASNDNSVVTSQSRIIPHISKAVLSLAVVSAILSCFFSWQVFLAISLAAFLLRLTLHNEKKLSQTKLRVLADALLLTPLLFVWL